MAYALRRAYFAAISAAGLTQRLLARRAAQDLFVLNFHKVEPEHDPFWWPVHPRHFESLVVELGKHFRFRTVHDCMKQDGRPGLILSFDDGYLSFLDYVAPILQRHGVKANLNVIVNAVATGKPPWNVQLYDFLRAAPLALVRELEVPGFSQRLESATDSAKTRFGLALSRFLKNRSRDERDGLLAAMEPTMHKLQERSPTPMLLAEHLRQLAGCVELGAHSLSHDSMGFESDDSLRDDCAGCAAFFAAELATPLRIYAFPNGSYRPRQIGVVLDSGVETVLLVDERIGVWGDAVLPRITMYGHSHAELMLRACGYWATGRGANVRH